MGKMYGSELAQRIARTGMKVFGIRSNLWSSEEELAPLNATHTQNYCHTVVGTIAGGIERDPAQHHRHPRPRPASRLDAFVRDTSKPAQ